MKPLHISLNTAHSRCKPSTFISSFTHSYQVFLPLPTHLTPANTTFVQADTQSSSLLRSKPPQSKWLYCARKFPGILVDRSTVFELLRTKQSLLLWRFLPCLRSVHVTPTLNVFLGCSTCADCASRSKFVRIYRCNKNRRVTNLLVHVTVLVHITVLVQITMLVHVTLLVHITVLVAY